VYGVPELTETSPRNLWQIDWFCFYSFKQSVSSVIALGVFVCCSIRHMS